MSVGRGKHWGDGVSERVVWHVVKQYARKLGLTQLAPHDLKRSCAKLCHASGGELDQIQFLLGHVSVTNHRALSRLQTTHSRSREQQDRYRTVAPYAGQGRNGDFTFRWIAEPCRNGRSRLAYF